MAKPYHKSPKTTADSYQIRKKVMNMKEAPLEGSNGDFADVISSRDSTESAAGMSLNGSEVVSSSSPKTAPSSNTSKQEMVIAKSENQAVLRIRLFVIAILVALTVCVAVLVFHFTRSSEVAAFEKSFYEDSEKIFESIGTTLDASLGAIDTYAVSIVSYARATNATWPFVYVPDYATRLAKVRALSQAFWIGEYRVVQDDEIRAKWENFSIANAGWVDEALEVQKKDPTFSGIQVEEYYLSKEIFNNTGISPPNSGPYYPSWQDYPSIPLYFSPFNWDGATYPSLAASFRHIEQERTVVIGVVGNLPDPLSPYSAETVQAANDWLYGFVGDAFDHTEPYVDIQYPVFPDISEIFADGESRTSNNEKLVSVLSMGFYWKSLIEDVLPPGSDGLIVVAENTCGQSFTYQINGPIAVYLGPGDLHDSKYDELELYSKLSELKDYHTSNTISYTGFPLSETLCPYSVRTYPSQEAEDRFLTSQPATYTATAISIFLLTSAVFFLYDFLVERRQQTVMKSAVQSNAIVSSLFPSNVRKRLYDMDGESAPDSQPQKNRLKTWLSDGKDASIMDGSLDGDKTMSGQLAGRPIADLFPEATVLFADISGFTAWSSIREPSQVFILLENLYGAFDKIAAKRGVFKVETIGDSYVAVAGLPEPREDHAVVMAKFAGDCKIQMHEVTRRLGVTLGPDTEDLAMRFGLHSGPVTAGVLRGQKSRFQLFGDTVNTAARMESTGERHKIQVSQATANYLTQSRKSHWLLPREDTVEVKGKGTMQTYWIIPRGGAKSVAKESTNSESPSIDIGGTANTKLERLIEWNVDALAKMIRHIIHRRKAVQSTSNKKTTRGSGLARSHANSKLTEKCTVLDEVKEIIELPDYDGYQDNFDDNHFDALEPVVMSQLREYVVAIATSYEMNPFHNFEHASHVCMSVAKLLSRIVAADSVYDSAPASSNGAVIASTKHDHTYGITSDPLTQFACVFSALIHDAEHPGVPNTQLVKEETPLALKYNGRSVAEQNSVDSSWKIFMDDKFSDLRAAICPDGEMKRFRQLVVNSVMATDIMDRELKALRDARWGKAFSEQGLSEPNHVSRNRKATIVIEHLLQASDVAHTMQHWHIYRKWNERLFEEMYRAYQSGRADKDPSEFWYKGEIGFFDFYIIPLAKKLSECGVFGVSSDEYLNYAIKNREEWERRGEEVVAGMVKQLKASGKQMRLPSSPVRES